MIEESNKHPEFMDMLKNNNPVSENAIDQDDNWYFADKKYVSNSMLKVFQKSGIKNYDKYLQGELKVTSKAFDIGSAFHCLILEPDHFHERFHIFDDEEKCVEISGKDWKANNKKPRSTKAYKEWYAEEIKPIEDDPYTTILTQAEMDNLIKMEEALVNIEEAVNLINACDEKESIYHNKLEGVAVKSKIDGFKYDDFMIDLKTTSGSVKEFIDSCYKYAYDQQAGFYSDVVEVKDFYFIVVESQYPYNVGVFKCGETFLERGKNKYKSGLQDLKYFLENKDFDVDTFYFRETLV